MNDEVNDEDGVGHLDMKLSIWIEDNPRYTKSIHKSGLIMFEWIPFDRWRMLSKSTVVVITDDAF